MLWELMLGITILNFLYGDMWFFFFAVFEINDRGKGRRKFEDPEPDGCFNVGPDTHSDYHFPICHWF